MEPCLKSTWYIGYLLTAGASPAQANDESLNCVLKVTGYFGNHTVPRIGGLIYEGLVRRKISNYAHLWIRSKGNVSVVT